MSELVNTFKDKLSFHSVSVYLFIGYSVIGLKYSLVLASIAAVTSVVPYLGPTIAISPAIVIAAITSPWMLFKISSRMDFSTIC